MKLPVSVLAGLVGADESVNEPIKSLKLLTGFSEEILRSGAFDHKPLRWRDMWVSKFQINADRMERNFGREKCSFYDADIHTLNYEYDTENACNGMKMIIDGFKTWWRNHLSRCSGQKNKKFQPGFEIVLKICLCFVHDFHSYFISVVRS